MLKSSDSLGAAARVALILFCIFQAGELTLTSASKLSYRLLAQNKYVNTYDTPETGRPNGRLQAKAWGWGP